MSDDIKLTSEAKKDLLRKYVKGLGDIWKKMVDEGDDEGDPLELFHPAIQMTEKSLKNLLD